MFRLQLTHDILAAGAKPDPLPTQHAMIYVCEGSAEINGEEVSADDARYAEDQVTIVAGEGGAEIWRFEILPLAETRRALTGEGVRSSTLKIIREIKMFELVPTTNWEFRLDTIMRHQGSTGMHSHPGSGIRCMREGQMRIESSKGENSHNEGKGATWYEEGSYPINSTADEGRTATFLRALILPPEFQHCHNTAFWAEGVPATNAGLKIYSQRIVTLR